MAPNISYIYFHNGVTLTESAFGTLNGETVKKFTWKTESGLEIVVISYGAIIQAIRFPDTNGTVKDIALGFDDVEGYVNKNTPDLLGCVVGRCVNRIANGVFTLDGEIFTLTKNLNNQHHLHGGSKGFDKANWKSTIDGTKVILSHLSRDGDQGYPGDLIVNLTYDVRNDGTFHVEYKAMTNMKTVVNLTNHSYFNLAGHETGAEGLYEQTIVINSDKILEGDADWVPTGRFLDVGGTPYDLRVAKTLRNVVNNDNDLRFHHNFVVNRVGNQGMSFVSRVEHPPSGRYMEIHSDQPSVVFYTGNFIQGQGHPDMVGKGGILYGRCSGLCLEPMNLVDAIHHPNFPSPVLSPGEVYENRMYFSFGLKS